MMARASRRATSLLRLDPTETQANLAAVSNALWELTARRARLEAERDAGETIAFPRELEDAVDPEVARIVTGERKLFELRREAQRGQKSQLRERIAQLSEEIKASPSRPRPSAGDRVRSARNWSASAIFGRKTSCRSTA